MCHVRQRYWSREVSFFSSRTLFSLLTKTLRLNLFILSFGLLSSLLIYCLQYVLTELKRKVAMIKMREKHGTQTRPLTRKESRDLARRTRGWLRNPVGYFFEQWTTTNSYQLEVLDQSETKMSRSAREISWMLALRDIPAKIQQTNWTKRKSWNWTHNTLVGSNIRWHYHGSPVFSDLYCSLPS